MVTDGGDKCNARHLTLVREVQIDVVAPARRCGGPS
jgi:hypothetical protein